MRLYSPKEIPIHFFFFGWKKAQRFIRTDHSLYDPIEIEEFNQNLYLNLENMKQQFSLGVYLLSPTITYLLPKSMKGNDPRARPMVQFSFRDQVAWATIMLVLGEWFDSSMEIRKRIPLHQNEQRKAYSWMVPWSYNNRIKRMTQLDELDGEQKRLFVHYHSPSIYESFQWGLRNLREERKRQFESIRSKYGEVWYGEADIQEFYPSLKMKYVKQAIKSRFKQLVECKVIEEDSEVLWMILLDSMCDFQIDFLNSLKNSNDEKAVVHLLKGIPFRGKTNLYTDNELDSVYELAVYLKDSLPIGLISSGFLSNCVLTNYFDLRLDQWVSNNVVNRIKGQGEVYLTRYTDDMMFVASNANLVYEVMQEACKLLEEIGIYFSSDKSIPKNMFFDRDDPDKTLITEENLNSLIPVIKKRERIPGSTAVIEKLSQFSDRKLWAMNHEQLKKYMDDMLSLINTNYDPSEIKDETKTSFAAWRLRASADEAIYRNLGYPKQEIKTILRDTIARFPYKFNLIESYIMHLFEIAKSEDIYIELDKFLACFTEKKQLSNGIDSGDYLGGYGSYLRTSVMVAISYNWSKVPVIKRDRVNGIIFDRLSICYQSTPMWHEKVSMYWMFAVTNMKRDLGAISNALLVYEHKTAQNSFRIFQCTLKNPNALFEVIDEQFSSENTNYMKVMIDILNQRRQKEARITNTISADEENWIKWCWKQIKRLEDIHSHEFAYQQCVYLLSIHARNLIPVFGFKILIQADYKDDPNEDKLILYNQILSLSDQVINLWVDYPKERRVIDNFIDAFKSVLESDPKNNAVNYVKKRLCNLAWIKIYICKNKNGISRLPEEILPQLNPTTNRNGKAKIRPTLLDWLTVTNSSTLSKDERLTHPLSELEILLLIKTIISKIDEGPFSRCRLRNITILPEEWNKWRRAVMNNDIGHKFNLHILGPNENYSDPDWYYIKNTLKYIEQIQSSDNREMENLDFQQCFIYTVLLAQLYSQGHLKGSSFDFSNLLSWKGTQYVLDVCNFPSSKIAGLITSTINYFYMFYQDQYKSFGNIQVPYRPILGENVVDGKYFIETIQEVLIESSKRYLSWSQGILEVRVENMDMWMKED